MEILTAGGWFDGRRVQIDAGTLPRQFAIFPAAENVLVEFQGLHLGVTGRGIDCAASDIEVEPLSGAHLAPHIAQYEEMLSSTLYPLGRYHDRNFYIFIDQMGRIYVHNDRSKPRAGSFDRALELLLLGQKLTVDEFSISWPAGVSWNFEYH